MLELQIQVAVESCSYENSLSTRYMYKKWTKKYGPYKP